MSSSRRRSSKKESYWRELVVKWRVSGLSQAEFSRQTEISVNTLGYWKRRLDREVLDRGASASIVAVPISHPAEPKVPHRPIIIHAGGGFRLEIAGDFHPVVLEKVLRTLERLA